ncbi:MAG: molecular chaperone HtpG [Clostridium sp.]|nr:molecular chaperone HtpG [Clostridium sp.]MCM1444280.1 molecular chaperone HtpG [Candidatus Amulumruptor caecigallinarius]
MKKEFKAESKRLLDIMINSIYTNKEIFLREIISNASDAIDKLYYLSLTDSKVEMPRDKFEIRIDLNKENKTLTISDNGIGMTKEELENNLGTIARSGSLSFKQENENQSDVNIIGQFGVGFYSAFMVSKNIKVLSKAYGESDAYIWESDGEDGYIIEKSKKDNIGTTITLELKEDDDDFKYSEYLEEYKIRSIIKKYSDYIRYPIVMQVNNRVLKEGTEDEYEDVLEDTTLNSMVPLWKKDKKDITDEDYNNFYSDKFYDYEKPLKVINSKVEGQCSYNALLFIPSHAPYDFYSKEYEKGLQLYSNGVLIQEKCGELLPDYFNFVRGIVDTQDISLNISRELLQQDKNLGIIAKSIESKIKNELTNMLKNNREEYKKFFKVFGLQLKFGIYNNYGMDKDKLKDLVLFYSYSKKDYITLKEYIDNMNKDQESIYYACGETIDKIDLLPQVELIKDKGFDILYLTEYVDEFTIQSLTEYEGKKFVNVSSNDLNLNSEEENKALETLNKKSEDLFKIMKKSLKDNVKDIRFTNRLKKHPVCLTTEGDISVEMEKVLNAMPTEQKVKANTILEINSKHKIAKKLKDLQKNDPKKLEKYTKILYSQARIIEGLPVDNPTEISNLICEVISE